jgi:hypothetical protein
MTVRCEDKNLKLELAGSTRNKYHCRVPVSHSVDDVLSPDYFGLLQGPSKLTVGDRIEVEWQDFSCMFELVVLAQTNISQLICRRVTEIVTFGEMAFPKDWEAKWMGDAEKYGIFHKGALKDAGHLSKEAALTRVNAMIAADAQAAQGRAMNAGMVAEPKTKAKVKADEAA